MSENELLQLIGPGFETGQVEFKGPGKYSDKRFRCKIIRAIYGMANRRDGGYVLLGIDDDAQGITLTGMEPNSVSAWSQDNLTTAVSEYADSTTELRVSRVTHDGKLFIVEGVMHLRSETPANVRDDGARRSANDRIKGPPHRPRLTPDDAEHRERTPIGRDQRYTSKVRKVHNTL